MRPDAADGKLRTDNEEKQRVQRLMNKHIVKHGGSAGVQKDLCVGGMGGGSPHLFG